MSGKKSKSRKKGGNKTKKEKTRLIRSRSTKDYFTVRRVIKSKYEKFNLDKKEINSIASKVYKYVKENNARFKSGRIKDLSSFLARLFKGDNASLVLQRIIGIPFTGSVGNVVHEPFVYWDLYNIVEQKIPDNAKIVIDCRIASFYNDDLNHIIVTKKDDPQVILDVIKDLKFICDEEFEGDYPYFFEVEENKNGEFAFTLFEDRGLNQLVKDKVMPVLDKSEKTGLSDDIAEEDAKKKQNKTNEEYANIESKTKAFKSVLDVLVERKNDIFKDIKFKKELEIDFQDNIKELKEVENRIKEVTEKIYNLTKTI